MKKILLTNDDGYKSAGFFPLLNELKQYYETYAVVPDKQKSWVGKSISAHTPITSKNIELEKNEIYVSTGTPADCVQLGLYEILDEKPDFVISGINIGSNTGHGRILSSGTVGAAMEGAIDGVKSVAISVCNTGGRNIDYFSSNSYKYFKVASQIAVKIINRLDDIDLPENIDVICINIPFDPNPNADFVITKPHKEPYGKLFHKTGKLFEHRGLPLDYSVLPNETDIKAVYEGKISITPLDLNLASQKAIDFLRENL